MMMKTGGGSEASELSAVMSPGPLGPPDSFWHSDCASVLLPKALLPTPSSRYCQPPPAFSRSARGPLFPVPPPGSCLLPPPPLAGEANWHDLTPSKAESWRKLSCTGGEVGEMTSPPSSSAQPVLYNYKSSNTARPRTLLEVPMQTKTESESVQGNQGNLINIFQSTLDPNSRPFTPAVTGDTTSSSSSQDSSLTLSKPEDDLLDPLLNDLKLFLPELDISQDEPKEDKIKALSNQELKISLPTASIETILPPPIFPFGSHWSGKSRPPLLPTPKNFPPFGPRQSETESCAEEPPMLSPWSPLTTGLSSQESLAVRKQGMIRKFSSQTKTPLTPGNMGTERKTYSEVSKLTLAEDFREEKDSSGDGWLPLGLSWMPPSLTESHPAPDEYLVTKVIGSKLPPIKLHNCHTDLLFFLFYSFQSDKQQLVAAGLLFDRGWRYHKVEQIWLARWPGLVPEKKSQEFDWEEGLYQYFDVKLWKRVPGWFRLYYDKLAEKPPSPH